jgi:Tfp pilus assembly protein PilP
MVRPRPVKVTPVQNRAAKKPAEPIRAVVQAPAVPSPVALADQTPALAEAGHGRDPFAALVRAEDPNATRTNLPPGIAGLQVATLRIQGMVKTPDGMVAVVANPQDSVYFLHDGDHIYDGVIEKIGLDDIVFRQDSKDAFGRAVERNVSKRLYPIAGDEQ